MVNIKVELVNQPDFETSPEGLIAGLAKITMHKDKFKAWKQKEKAIKLTKRLIAMDHVSLLESIDLGVVIHGASRIFLDQITRHRSATYMSGSQQYQLHNDFNYFIPESIQNLPSAFGIYTNLMGIINFHYKALEKIVGRDDARYILPGATRNQLYIKTNIRSWLNIFEQRLCTRNTNEMVKIMKLIRNLFIENGYKTFFEKSGLPTCVYGKCNQGKMFCGIPIKKEDLNNE